MVGLKHPKFNEAILNLQVERDVVLRITQENIDFLRSGDFIGFIESLQIITKAEGMKSLFWNLTQEELWHWFLMKREGKLAIRGISVKSRQQGISSFWTAIAFADVFLRANRFAFMASHEAPSTHSIFGKARTFQQHLSKDWKTKRPLERFTRFEIKYAPPHNSQFTCATANNQSLASGTTIHDLHLSEIAKWKNPPANDAITSVLGCVPDHYDTWIFWESTAFGAHDLFHHWWLAAKLGPDSDKWNGYDALFFSPRGFKEYYFYFIGDNDIPENAVVVKKPTFTQEELDFQKEWNICDNQMAWFVDKLRNKYQNNWGETNQELPWHDSLAFKFSGYQWFHAAGLAALSECVRPPIAKGTLMWVNDEDPLVEWKDMDGGNISIWEWPEKGVWYYIGSDISEGVGGDYSVTWVGRPAQEAGELDRFVARFKTNRINAHEVGVINFQLGMFYNRAFTGVEKQNQGHLTCDTMERGGGVPQMSDGYPNLYYHTVTDKRTLQRTQRIGWNTSSRSTKQIMLGHFQRRVAEQSLWIPCQETLIEMEGFAFDPKRSDWVQKNTDDMTHLAHDDEIMSGAILLQMFIHGADRASMPRAKELAC